MAREILFYLAALIATVQGHGYLQNPPSRNSMWREGFPNRRNVDDTGLNCGGFSNQWKTNNGSCGLCGDPYQGPRIHEAGRNGYANGIIGKVYQKGQIIEVTIKITANHGGWFEFHLCPNNDPSRAITQECLDKYPLVSPDNGRMRQGMGVTGWDGETTFRLELPEDVTCNQCVLQWVWYVGNSRGRLRQESFVNCADIGITNADGTVDGGLSPPVYNPPNPVNVFELSAEKVQQDLEGEWDCAIRPGYLDNVAKIPVHYGWCMANCIYPLRKDKHCNEKLCDCRRMDKELSEAEIRHALNLPTTAESAPAGTLEGVWECKVIPPYEKTAVEEENNHLWCMEHCIHALPSQRQCPTTHCSCWRVDKDLSREEIRELLKPAVIGATADDHDIKAVLDYRALVDIEIKPNGLDGTWDCDVVGTYRFGKKAVGKYRWCIDNCINALPHQRQCSEIFCNCYRTDKQFSIQDIRRQLGGQDADGNAYPHVVFTKEEADRRGEPPPLHGVRHAIAKPNLEGKWECEAPAELKPFPVQARQRVDWCKMVCLEAQPDQRDCAGCNCRRTDKRITAKETRLALQRVVWELGYQPGATTRRPTTERTERRRPNILRRNKVIKYIPTTTTAAPTTTQSIESLRDTVIQGWRCSVRSPHDDPKSYSTYHSFCIQNCVIEETGHCARDICRCRRVGGHRRKVSGRRTHSRSNRTTTEKPQTTRTTTTITALPTMAGSGGQICKWISDIQKPDGDNYCMGVCYYSPQPNCPKDFCRCDI